MAGAATCLFRDLDLGNPCQGNSSEHPIPRGVGGTVESTDILCDRCNHYFGDEIDPELCEHFEPIITTLAPVLGGDLRGRRIRAQSIDGGVRLLQRGGAVELPAIHRERDAQGDLVAIYAPQAQANVLPQIAAREAPGQPFAISTVPVTDALDEGLIGKRRGFTDELRRAVAKTVLEVADHYGRLDGAVHFRRTAALDPIRRAIRIGERAHLIEPHSPMVRLEGALDGALAANLPPGGDAGRLSTCVVAVYDAQASRLFGLLSVAGTMPLCVSLAEAGDWGPASWSLLVRRGLLPGPAAHAWVPHAVMTWPAAERAALPGRTAAEVRRARSLYNDVYADAVGRSIVYADLHDDLVITATLQELRQARGSGAAAVVEALQIRFLANGLTEENWRGIRDRVDADNLGVDDAATRNAFRRELEGLVARVGVPRAVIQRGNA